MVQETLQKAVTIDGLAFPAFTLRHVRVSQETAAEFWEELALLAERFAKAPRGGDRVYGLLAGIYPTELPTLPEDDEGESI